MKNDKLNSVEIALSDYGLPVHRGVHSEGASFEYLSVILPPDLQGRPRQLIIRFSEVHIPAAKGEGASQRLINCLYIYPLRFLFHSLRKASWNSVDFSIFIIRHWISRASD